MRRSIPAFAILLGVLACATNCSSPAGPGSDPIVVQGGDMGVEYQNVVLQRKSGVLVSGAQVTVNGLALTDRGNGFYQGQLASPLGVGATITLEVHIGSESIKGTAKVPAVPVLTSPVSGAGVKPGTPLSFTWTSPTSPDEFMIFVNYHTADGGLDKRTTVGGTARSGSVDTTGIPLTAFELSAEIFAYANGTFTGAADPSSKMHVRQSMTTSRPTLVITP